MKKSNIKKMILLASFFAAFGLAAYGTVNAKSDDVQVLKDPSTRVVSKDSLSKDSLSKGDLGAGIF
jgi:hypothetical protein